MLQDILAVFCFGTGGLVRAYSESLTGAIDKASIVQKDLGYIAELQVNYNNVEKLKYFFSTQNINIIDTEFDKNVKFIIEIQKEKYDKILTQKEEFKFKIIDSKIKKESYIIIP